MKNNLKNFLGIIIMICFLILPFLVFAQEEEEAGSAARGQQMTTQSTTGATNESRNATGGNSALSTLGRVGEKSGYNTISIEVAAGTIVNAALSVLGIIFIIIIIIGGFKWLTARGDEAEVTKALAYIKSAIIGLIITLSAGAIWFFIASRLT